MARNVAQRDRGAGSGLGADDATIEATRQLILAQDATQVAGQFPDLLATADSLKLLRTASSAFKGIRIAIGSPMHDSNPDKRQMFKVWVISRPNFDATTIDPLSVRFGPNAASEAFAASVDRRNKQGFVILTLYFWSDETGITCGDRSAVITGKLLNGDPFVGRGAVRIADCKGDHRPRNRWDAE